MPVLFGVGILLLLLFFVKDMGRPAVLLAALCAALSPAFSYYSRFYIQEMLFVFFIAGIRRIALAIFRATVLGLVRRRGNFRRLDRSPRKKRPSSSSRAAAAALVSDPPRRRKQKERRPPPAQIPFSHIVLALGRLPS